MAKDYNIEPLPTNVGGWNPTVYANDMALKINHLIAYAEYLQARIAILENLAIPTMIDLKGDN